MNKQTRNKNYGNLHLSELPSSVHDQLLYTVNNLCLGLSSKGLMIFWTM